MLERSRDFRGDAVWLATIAAAAVVGIALVFSILLHWPRSLYLVPYVLIVGGLSLLQLRRIGFAWRDLAHNWVAGLAVAAAASYFVIGSLDRYPPSWLSFTTTSVNGISPQLLITIP